MSISDLLRTDIHLAQLLGELDEREDYFVVRTPQNPGFFYGNLLVLKSEPEELERWIERFDAVFGGAALHRCIAWSGQSLGESLRAEAQQSGFETEGTSEMMMAKAPTARNDWTVRPLDLRRDWEASVALNKATDVTEQVGDESYRLFKLRLRETWRTWIERGYATWWGAFDGEQLIGQCGFVPCGELGRFQAVETHPDWQRRGVCGSLITAVARDGFERLGLDRLLLVAEVDGSALNLYRSLGFVETGHTHSLLQHRMPLYVRAEQPGDYAAVRSLVSAAFAGQDEAELINATRTSEGAISLVAEQTNSLLGQILFTLLQIDGAGKDLSAVALAPLSVRPVAQRRGVGAVLVKAGIDACRTAGHDLCLVIGDPDYYARFGFIPANSVGLINQWGIADAHFMVLELSKAALANCGGRAIYLEAFDAL